MDMTAEEEERRVGRKTPRKEATAAKATPAKPTASTSDNKKQPAEVKVSLNPFAGAEIAGEQTADVQMTPRADSKDAPGVMMTPQAKTASVPQEPPPLKVSQHGHSQEEQQLPRRRPS